MMNERLLSPKQFADRLGGMNEKDVRVLIQRGEIKAKQKVVRGRGGHPRYWILESEYRRYVRDLPDFEPTPEDRPAAGAKPKTQPPRKNKSGQLAGVIEFVH